MTVSYLLSNKITRVRINIEAVGSTGLDHIVFLLYLFVKLARRPPPAPGGEMLYSLQKGDTRDQEGPVWFVQAVFM